MKKYNLLLFDLDGTLTDPAEGITRSIQHALRTLGYGAYDKEKLLCFIGPPLLESFQKYFNMNEQTAHEAIRIYREYFSVKGLYENEIYLGIAEMLEGLKQSNYRMAIATSKPTVFAEKILEYFSIRNYFELVVGSELDGTRNNKAEVIAYALAHLDIPDKQKIIMIGDREHDIIGANKNAIDSIGVLYGYGCREEFITYGATFIVETVDQLSYFFSKN